MGEALRRPSLSPPANSHLWIARQRSSSHPWGVPLRRAFGHEPHTGRGRGGGRKSARHSAPQIVLGMAVAAGKQRASQPQDGVDLIRRHALRQQHPRHPQIYDAPVRWYKALRNLPAVYPGLVEGGRLGCAYGGRQAKLGRADVVGMKAPMRRRKWGRRHLGDSGPQQVTGVTRQARMGVYDFYPRGVV